MDLLRLVRDEKLPKPFFELFEKHYSSKTHRSLTDKFEAREFVYKHAETINICPETKRAKLIKAISQYFKIKTRDAYLIVCECLKTPDIDYDDPNQVENLLKSHNTGFIPYSSVLMSSPNFESSSKASTWDSPAKSPKISSPKGLNELVDVKNGTYLFVECDNLDLHSFVYVRKNYVQTPLRPLFKAPEQVLKYQNYTGTEIFSKPHPSYDNCNFPRPILSVEPSNPKDPLEKYRLITKNKIEALAPITDYTGFVTTPALLSSIFNRSYYPANSSDINKISLIHMLRHVLYLPTLNLCIDARFFGSEARFVTFSASKIEINAFVKEVYINKNIHIQLHAMRDINPGESICISAEHSWIQSSYYSHAINTGWMKCMRDPKTLETIPYTSSLIWKYRAEKPCLDIQPYYSENSSLQSSERSNSKVTSLLFSDFTKIQTDDLKLCTKGFNVPQKPSDTVNDAKPFSVIYDQADIDAIEKEIRHQSKSYLVYLKKQSMKRLTAFVKQQSILDVDSDQLQREVRAAIKANIDYVVQEFYCLKGLSTKYIPIKVPQIILQQFKLNIRDIDIIFSEIDFKRSSYNQNDIANKFESWKKGTKYPVEETVIEPKVAYSSRSFIGQALSPPLGYFSESINNRFEISETKPSISCQVLNTSQDTFHLFDILQDTFTHNDRRNSYRSKRRM